METRTPLVVLLFAAFTFCTASGLLLFKHAWPEFHAAWTDGRAWSKHGLLVAAGASLYATSFLLWLVIVSRLPLTVAYPVAIGLSLVAISAGAIHWLGEPFSWTRAGGAALILAGIALVFR
jgi:drug/metabolite transporter (DMT)-like permease